MLFARVVKLVDAGDSKSPAARRAGSIPAPGTISEKPFLRMQRRLFRIWAAMDQRPEKAADRRENPDSPGEGSPAQVDSIQLSWSVTKKPGAANPDIPLIRPCLFLDMLVARLATSRL